MTIAVIGAGTMGRGIAQVLAMGGYQVLLYDVSPVVVEEALFYIGQRLASQARNARMAQEESEAVIRRIRAITDLTACADVDFVIEAVPEKMHLKRQVFAELDQICDARTVFASNTSGLSITEMAGATKRPKNVIGMHFFHPVPVMQLVELIRGSETGLDAFEKAQAICDRIGKTTIEVTEAPLFVVNRILVPMLNEAIFVLQEGLASPEDIDTGMKLGANHPIGPIALADMVGLDTLLDVSQTLFEETGDTKYRPPLLLKQMVRAGKLGRKCGIGFYQYSE